MFNKIKALTLALALTAFSLAGVAHADDSSTEPTAPAKATLENGRVNVYLGTPLVSGYAIGDSIPVTILFEMTPDNSAAAKPAAVSPPKPEAPPAPSVPTMSPNQPTGGQAPVVTTAPAPTPLVVPVVDVEGLKMQVQSSEALDVEMLKPASDPVIYERDGKVYLKVVYYVWTFTTVKQQTVDVKADFSYAVSKLEDGSLNWVKGATPTITIGTHKTATDNQTKMLEGNLKPRASSIAPATYIVLGGGVLMLLPLFAALALSGYRRVMQPKKLSGNAKFWTAIDPVLAEAKKEGKLSMAHYKRIFFKLREHFQVSSKDGDELLAALAANEELANVDAALIKQVFDLESVFYIDDAVSPEQEKAFTDSLEKLVPRR
jgi:hypothetical protein